MITRKEFQQQMQMQAKRLQESREYFREWGDGKGMFRRLVPHTQLGGKLAKFGCVTEIKIGALGAWNSKIKDIAIAADVPQIIYDVGPQHFAEFQRAQLAAYDHFHGGMCQ